MLVANPYEIFRMLAIKLLEKVEMYNYSAYTCSFIH